LGGWYGPLAGSEIPGALVLILKALFLVFVQMWLRFTLPRLRVDQLMHVCWKVFVPLAFVSLIGASVLELV
jgi:NADH-quinone oxidoreductase subunit H